MPELNDKKLQGMLDEDGESGESGGSAGGRGGAIAFRDFVMVHEDKKFSPAEEKQLLAVHKETNSGLIEKQKKLRDQRQDKKEGRTAGYQLGAGMEARSAFSLKHPILGEAAEFDSIDPKVNLDPSIYDAETNADKKEELTYQHQLRLGLQNQPHFNPKPSPF